MKKVYIAAPFFNKMQSHIVTQIEEILTRNNIPYFSPRKESNFKQGDDPKEILEINCNAIHHSEYVIVITDDKDVGTIWEAGYAFCADRPIIYVWLGYVPSMKFNIMLAASGNAVVHNMLDLQYQIRHYKTNGKFIPINSKGMLHE